MKYLNKIHQIGFIFMLASLGVQAHAQSCDSNLTRTRPDSRYEVVAGTNSAEVKDKVTGLIWQRCTVGQSWSGSACTGTTTQRTWTAALDAARNATATSATTATVWRLPNQNELFSLTERACTNPSINATWFPSTDIVSYGYWSSTTDAGSAIYAWAVNFSTGGSINVTKSQNAVVRLVRSSP